MRENHCLLWQDRLGEFDLSLAVVQTTDKDVEGCGRSTAAVGNSQVDYKIATDFLNGRINCDLGRNSCVNRRKEMEKEHDGKKSHTYMHMHTHTQTHASHELTVHAML